MKIRLILYRLRKVFGVITWIFLYMMLIGNVLIMVGGKENISMTLMIYITVLFLWIISTILWKMSYSDKTFKAGFKYEIDKINKKQYEVFGTYLLNQLDKKNKKEH